MTDIKNFYSDLLKIGKKSHRGFDIYYIGYNMIKKLSSCNCKCNCDCDYENICSVNSLYLIIHSATRHFKEKYDEKYLILDSTEECKEVSSGIKSGIETINGGKELFYEKNYARIGVLELTLNFPTLTIIIRCVFQKFEELDPLIYFDECLYESV